MPTSTFFRLPEEKRQRLLDAAWEEFSSCSFADASINQIIHNAHIPRGSFYQYFQDKEELFWYLMGSMREYFSQSLQGILQDVSGDLFAMPVRAFDRFVGRKGKLDPILSRCIQVMRKNQGMDFHHFLANEPGLMPESLAELVDSSQLRKREPGFLDQVFFLMIAPLAYAIMETLRDPNQWEHQRELLEQRIEIVKWGSLEPAGSERLTL
ncbi:MAG: TetR/AcrR family transcriptional regulator [Lawsonibacter sp.]|jgi:AcrR family transcriptional regulator